MKELPPDLEDGINLLEKAENNTSDHKLFNKYFADGVDLIHAFLADFPDSPQRKFAEHKLYAHTRSLLVRLISVNYEDMDLYAMYQFSLVRVKKYIEKICSEEPAIRSNLDNFLDKEFDKQVLGAMET